MLTELIQKAIHALKGKTKNDVVPVPLVEKARDVVVPQLDGKYKLRVTPLSFGNSGWNYLIVEIQESATGKTLGGYTRTYGSLYSTFHPFVQDGKEYALYSKDYTATRVMSLPDCVDLGGEEKNAHGFCPTGYYVPQPNDAIRREWDEVPDPTLDGKFGFVCGCVWGDDSGGWKLEYLDLSKITEGILKREARFGYLQVPVAADELEKAIDLRNYAVDEGRRRVSISIEVDFDVERTVGVDFSELAWKDYLKQDAVKNPTLIQKCATCSHVGRFHSSDRCYISECKCTTFVSPPDEPDED